MAKEDSYERDLVLAPNTFAYILDKSQGEVVAHVGPTKVSLADTDQPVKFNPETKRFDEVNLAASIQPLSIAPEGWYLILKNPSFGADGKLRLPNRGKNLSQDAQLTVGRKVNIPGPVSIALWPGQMAQVVQGHHLRSNQYLRARVYDEAAALKNRDQAIIKVTTDGGTPPNPDGKTPPADTMQGKNLIPEHFAIGQQFNIKGTDVSFFVPPTGIEIVRDDANDKQFIRDAETLEVLEYCILLDEDGNKEFKRGPAVIFPEPTQTFVSKSKDGTEVRKFLAFELNENMGLYIKVIADYSDKNADNTETHFKTGDELFITGKTHPVYFPREEHAIVRYGDNKKINYSVAIPAGEGRYVLDRKTGEVRTIFGPTMLLPDPRTEVVVRRVLKDREVTLMYPGNVSALEVNKQLNALRSGSEDYVMTNNLLSSGDAFAADTQSARSVLKHASGPQTRSATRKAMKDFAGDEMQRSDSYTPPRTITLDNKYDGVVTVNVWTGFAVNVVKKTGERRVVVGPKTVMLAYDESLEPLSLSRGCPKDKKLRKEDVYLRVLNNRVTDKVKLQTKDLVDISVVLSYRVNFTGEPSLWFNVDDYVGLLTDHMRSLLRNEVQRRTVEEFWGNKIDIVRDCVLGKSESSGRVGRSFEQNGMTIYDLDFVDAEIHNTQIAALLVNAQHESIRLNLELEKQRRDFGVFEEVERLKCERTKVTDATSAALVEFQTAEVKRRADLELAQVQLRQRDEETKLANQLRNQGTLEDIQGSELTRKERSEALTQKLAAVTQQMRITELNAIKDAEVAKVQAITPDLIAAMQSLTHTELVTKIAESLSPLAILGGESLVDVAKKLLTGTALEHVIDKLPTLSASNGKTTQRPLP